MSKNHFPFTHDIRLLKRKHIFNGIYLLNMIRCLLLPVSHCLLNFCLFKVYKRCYRDNLLNLLNKIQYSLIYFKLCIPQKLRNIIIQSIDSIDISCKTSAYNSSKVQNFIYVLFSRLKKGLVNFISMKSVKKWKQKTRRKKS